VHSPVLLLNFASKKIGSETQWAGTRKCSGVELHLDQNRRENKLKIGNRDGAWFDGASFFGRAAG
jgi:hypothetical protein